jgi:peptidyl-prolyl cis-trans isomerase D
MALIQKIREKSALVLIMMVLAIASFIAMLITQDSNRNWSDINSSSTIAKVAGESLDIRELESTAQTMYGNQGGDLNVRNYLFNQFVESTLVGKEAEALGIGVCQEELLELEFGAQPSQIIASNPSLAQNPAQLQDIKKAIKANTMPLQGKMYWAEIEKQVVADRLQNKLSNLMSKAIYTPTWLVEDGYKELTEPVDFEYVRVPFDRVDEKDAPVTDADYASYLKENQARYKNEEETRSIDYVSFDVIPSAADSAELLAIILDLKGKFKTAEKDSAFAVSHGGEVSPSFVGKEGVGKAVQDSLFTAPIGTIIGPYIENKVLMLTKLMERKISPDSVRSRHILLKGADAMQVADSIKNLLTANPALWDGLNAQYNTDKVAQMSGGDLQYQGQGAFVAEFNDLIFYKAEQGKFYTVPSQFGVHVVQVTGIKQGKGSTRIRIASVREPIIPSQKTDRNVSQAADELLLSSKNLEDLKKNATAKGLTLQNSSAFRINDMALGNLNAADGIRPLIRWAFDASIGERGKNTYALREQGASYNSKYVVAALNKIVSKGIPSVDAIKDQIAPLVKNRKKGEVLVSKITTSDLNAIATQFNTRVDSAKGVTYNATFVPNLGSEPRLLGSVFTTDVNQVTKPIIGESAVYVARVSSKTTLQNSPVDKSVLRQQLLAGMKGQARGFLSKGLRKNVTIADNRAKFF